MRKIYVREEVCIGCGLCQVYCQTEHSRSKEIIKAFKKESPRPLPRVRVERKESISFAVQCRHCAEPWCAYFCLTGALQQDPASGKVLLDAEKCTGCWTCILACPYGVLVRDKSRKIVAKCDLCPDREVPACVAHCPNEALVLGEEREAGEDLFSLELTGDS